VRPNADLERIRALVRELARSATEDTTIYLTGGATAVLHGWRESTVDVDLRLEPDSDELLRGIAAAKDTLHVNVELASPPDFIPELPGWRDRSPFAFSEGRITVRHFDPYSQALSKISRDFELDRSDVQAMIDQGLVDPDRLKELFEAIEPELFRYPSIDPGDFRAKVERTLNR
jgi:hypothetical protein